MISGSSGAPGGIECLFKICEYENDVSLESLARVFSELRSPAILGGNTAKTQDNRYSYFAAEPLETIEFNSADLDLKSCIETISSKYCLSPSSDTCNLKDVFKGGWIGYLSYDLKDYFEKLPNTCTDDLKMPLMRFCFYDRFIIHDNNSRKIYLCALDMPTAPSSFDKIAWLKEKLDLASHLPSEDLPCVDFQDIDFGFVSSNITQEEYTSAINKTTQYIHDGEIYQINFSQRFCLTNETSPIILYNWQSKFNPSPYSAYLAWDDFSVICTSPELFLDIRGRNIKTSPIKGTRPCLANQTLHARAENAANVAELLSCEKEQAELNMIIDLERNDLARICKPGTRNVSTPRHIKAFPTVYHTLATVSGELKDEIDLWDILKATFPGGSITGAPKIRAMEIIDELEPTLRAIYTGSIGYIGVDGSVCLNIVIRTVIIRANKAYVQTGGGIVADSLPSNEWNETITKAGSLLTGIQAFSRAYSQEQ